ncbi:MAG TPA: protein phosphatase 2C domain-containing protein [Candidatus Sulfopaludibacter sp.]|nr:protein phosphatase 2C domain-containing protein [Terriglobia bacterium]HEV2447828.1 protein phosphatase 2C domain-containing protein [Candidatus Sulfopaludibacter sp.]
MELNALGMSDQGRVRINNEDNLAACNLSTGESRAGAFECAYTLGPRGALLMVADGMGGEACGELASEMCVQEIPARLGENLKALANLGEARFALALRGAIEETSKAIYGKSRSQPQLRGMGSTTTAAALFGPFLFVAQVGDSRAYLIRDGRMTQLTRDQTFLNYLAELGVEPPADPENDPRKSILIQAVGTAETLDVKLSGAPLYDGDQVLLCSDGLYNQVKPAEMLGIAGRAESLARKAASLIQAANASGGADNITVVLAEFTGAGLPAGGGSRHVELREFELDDLGR